MSNSMNLLQYVTNPFALIGLVILVFAGSILKLGSKRGTAKPRQTLVQGLVAIGLIVSVGGLIVQTPHPTGQTSSASGAATAIAAGGSAVIARTPFDAIAARATVTPVSTPVPEPTAHYGHSQASTASGNAIAVSAARDVYIGASDERLRSDCTPNEPASSEELEQVSSGRSGVCLRAPVLSLSSRRVEVSSTTKIVGAIQSRVATADLPVSVPASLRAENRLVRSYEFDDAQFLGTVTHYVSVSTTNDVPLLGAPKTQHGSLEGHTVICTENDGAWKKSPLDIPDPTQEQKRDLATLCPDELSLYPNYKLHIGSTWSLTPVQIATLLGFANALEVDGSATAELVNVSKRGGFWVARVVIRRFEAHAQLVNTDGQHLRVQIGGHGFIERSLNDLVDVRSHFEGSWSTSIDAGSFEGRLVTDETQRRLSS